MSIIQALAMMALGIGISEIYNCRIRAAERRSPARANMDKNKEALLAARPIISMPGTAEFRCGEPPLPMTDDKPEPLPDWFAEDLRRHGNARARRVGKNWEKS